MKEAAFSLHSAKEKSAECFFSNSRNSSYILSHDRTSIYFGVLCADSYVGLLCAAQNKIL